MDAIDRGHEAPAHGRKNKPSSGTCDGRRAATAMDRARKECAMRSFYARGVALAIALASLANLALAQDAGLPSLLPLPPLPSMGAGFPVTRAAAANDANWYGTEQSPAALGTGITGPAQVINPSQPEVIGPG